MSVQTSEVVPMPAPQTEMGTLIAAVTATGVQVAIVAPPLAVGIAVVAIGGSIAYGIYKLFED